MTKTQIQFILSKVDIKDIKSFKLDNDGLMDFRCTDENWKYPIIEKIDYENELIITKEYNSMYQQEVQLITPFDIIQHVEITSGKYVV